MAEQRQTQEEANQWIVKIELMPMGSDETTLSGEIQYQAQIKLTDQSNFQVSGFHMTRNQLRVAFESRKGVKVKVVKWC